MSPRVDVCAGHVQPILEFDKSGLNFLYSDAQHCRVYSDTPVDGSRGITLYTETGRIGGDIVYHWLLALRITYQ